MQIPKSRIQKTKEKISQCRESKVNMSLKELKEQFVSNLNGGPVDEIYKVTGIALCGYFSHSILKKYALLSIEMFTGRPLVLVVEFLFDILLILQAITVYSSRIGTLYIHGAIPGLLLLLYKAVDGSLSVRRRNINTSTNTSKTNPSPALLPIKPFITAYRAHMLIITNLAILAVDFHAFPRRFAKVETWGTSLMDMGVGSFVFAMGLATSRAVIKRKLSLSDSPSTSPTYLRLIGHNCLKAMPLLTLGAIRLVSVKLLLYQEHVTEYGVHWNFFITLGLLPVVLGVLDPVLNVVPRFLVALAITVAYEVVLARTDVLAFLLDESNRYESVFAMNKEGFYSFFGYLSIFVFGQSLGSFVLTSRKTPNNLVGAYGPRTRAIRFLTVSTTRGLVVAAVVSQTLFYAASSSFLTGAVSRRMANLPYVLWVVSYNCAFLLGYDLVEKLVGPVRLTILDAVNKNGLAIFLVGNLLTGAVNMTVNTLTTSNGAAYGILILYSVIWVSLAIFLDSRKIYVKL